MNNIQFLQSKILELHARIRETVVAETERASLQHLASVAKDEAGDTIYNVDRVSEDVLIDFFRTEVSPIVPIILIAEGLDEGHLVLPAGTKEKDAVWRIIMDPIDGTRGLMYQKRSAWILTGVAPNRGESTGLQDIVLAVQTEIPTIKQHLSDCLYAVRGRGAHAQRFNRLTGETREISLQPSLSPTIAHGFASVSRFFPGVRDTLAVIDEEIVFGALGPVRPGKALCFEDQYISTGGQLYELMAGHDRFIADIRPLMEKILKTESLSLGICCNPYDICTELIAREMGVIITDERGRNLNPPLVVDFPVTWAGYANQSIRNQIEPLLHEALKKRELI